MTLLPSSESSGQSEEEFGLLLLVLALLVLLLLAALGCGRVSPRLGLLRLALLWTLSPSSESFGE